MPRRLLILAVFAVPALFQVLQPHAAAVAAMNAYSIHAAPLGGGAPHF